MDDGTTELLFQFVIMLYVWFWKASRRNMILRWLYFWFLCCTMRNGMCSMVIFSLYFTSFIQFDFWEVQLLRCTGIVLSFVSHYPNKFCVLNNIRVSPTFFYLNEVKLNLMIYTTSYHAPLNHCEKVGCVAGAFYITSKHCLHFKRKKGNVKFSKIIFFGGGGYKIFYQLIWMVMKCYPNYFDSVHLIFVWTNLCLFSW